MAKKGDTAVSKETGGRDGVNGKRKVLKKTKSAPVKKTPVKKKAEETLDKNPEDKRAETNLASVRRKERTELAMVDPNNVEAGVRSLVDTITGEKNYLDKHKLTKGQMKRLTKVVGILGGGYWRSIALICNENCILSSRCPLAIIHSDKHGSIDWSAMPSGTREECPVEHRVITDLEVQYSTAYADRNNVTPEEVIADPFIRDLIGELAETFVIEARLNTRLSSEGGSLLSEEAVAINNNGDMAIHMKESPIFSAKLKIKKRRDALMKQLLLTPEMELKRAVANRIIDPSSRQAEAMSRAKKYLEQDDNGIFTDRDRLEVGEL